MSGGKPKYREKAPRHEEFSATTVTSWRHHSSGAVLESRGRGCWGRDLADHVGHSHTRTSALHWPVSTLPHFLVILLPRLLRCSRVDHPLCRGGSGYQSTEGFNFQPLQPCSFKNRAVFGSPMCLVGNSPIAPVMVEREAGPNHRVKPQRVDRELSFGGLGGWGG